MDSDFDSEWFPLNTEAALADVKGLQSDDANLEVVVAAGTAGFVGDASALAPVARVAARRFFCN